MKWLGYLIVSVFGVGCGPIAAPPGAVDLQAEPAALAAAFDAQVGVPRLILLLSPA